MTADDSRLRVLTALARKMSHTESARRDAASFERFEERLAERRGVRARPLAARLALAGALVALVLGVYWVRGPGAPSAEAPLRYTLQSDPGATAALGARAEPGASSPSVQRMAFSDGSHVVLAPEAAAQVAEVSPHGARVRLARGRAEVSIARRAHAAWQFQAGPYTVKVTGTAFKLSWSEQLQQVEVGMHHGSVIVTGPLAPQGVTLRAGQHLVACDRTHRLLVEDWSASAERLARAELEPESPAAAELDAAPREPSRKAARNHRPAPREVAAPDPLMLARGTARFGDWAKKVAQGDFEGVLREAKQLGHARVLANANAVDLTALSDAARYARKNALGRDALLSLRARFPEAEMGRDSAFFLGRLSQGDDALEWYDRYLREQPEGTYVAQALGRSMMLRYEQGDGARAAQLAARYLARFPSGPYAGAARKLSGAAKVTSPAP